MAYNNYSKTITTTKTTLLDTTDGTDGGYGPRIMKAQATTSDVLLELHGVVPNPVGDPLKIVAGQAPLEISFVEQGCRKIVAYTTSGTATLDLFTVGY